jgi:hypothetical protein
MTKAITRKLNFDNTKKGIEYISAVIRNKEVSTIGAKSYLKYLGLNTDAQENIVKNVLEKNN